ncbi:Uncharacterised protein [Klebsiella pneumoniae]|nr:Uncharacterised protein [Klebsiella pneumoniae]
MVGDYAQRFITEIGRTGDLRHRLNQFGKQVDFVVRVHMLQDRTDALQAHACVHGWLRQRQHGAVGLTVELHKDDVPDLDIAVAILFRAARRAAPDVVAMVEEDLRARAARAGIAHLPEVIGSVGAAFVVADTDDALTRHANLVFPDAVSFVIGLIHGDPQLLFWQTEPLRAGQQLPGKANRLFLEVVAEAEVTQHLEEGVVTRGVPDVFEVIVLTTGAHAALRRGRTGVITLVLPEENVFKLVHPGVGE